jgi:hypothetical protein
MSRRDVRACVAAAVLLLGGTGFGCGRRMPPTDDPVPPQPPAPPSAAPARPPPKPPPEPPPSPQIVVDDAAGAAGDVDEQLRECEALGIELAGRNLATEQRTQLDSARRFLAESRAALDGDDISRAEVLADKGCQLLDALGRNSPER